MIDWLEKKRYVAIILTLLIALEIFYFSSISGTFYHHEGGVGFIPIIYHLVVFFLFNFFLLISIKGNKKIKISYIILALCISIIYALSDEFHQIFVPFRNASIQDILIDTIGIFLSTIFILYLNKKR
jgi:VanZ family protein